jgi:phosphoadenosine phosphosulfate reductase
MKQSGLNKPASIYWCPGCNLVLISQDCALCDLKSEHIYLGPPGDVRFCSPKERSVLHNILVSEYGTDPLGDRIILFNKIGGEDKTDQIIVDGLFFGILRFDLTVLDWQLDLQIDGAAVLTQHTKLRTVELSGVKGHLSGKTVRSDMIKQCSDDIRSGHEIIIRYNQLVGVGNALLDYSEMIHNKAPALRIRRIGTMGSMSPLKNKIATMEQVLRANEPAIRRLGKDAINTIRGIANQKEYRKRPIYVSFSGGKDSLAVLDLTRSALKRNPQAIFINTGLEFPGTVDYVRRFCKDNNIPLHEYNAGDAYWNKLLDYGPPAKDNRWCCEVCKLTPINKAAEQEKHLTINGKRRYESFSRSRIAPKEPNPFIPAQVNVYPIRDWRAIEVWMYIYWRGLEYNPLYDMGFERIGCWLCPASLSAEYRIIKELHPELYDKWNNYLHDWADNKGLSKEYIDYGFWRWRKHPPKMKLLARQLGINLPSTGAAI